MRPSLNFQQYGRIEYARSPDGFVFGSNQAYNKLENKLSYLTCSIYANHVFNAESKKLKIIFFFGLDNNFFINEKIRELGLLDTFSFYPRSEYESRWNAYYLSYSYGFRFRIFDLLGISTFYNRGISAALKTENLEVKNYSFGVSLDVDLLNILRD